MSRALRPLLFSLVFSAGGLVGCTLIAEVDRAEIDEDGAESESGESDGGGGAESAATSSDETDSGGAGGSS